MKIALDIMSGDKGPLSNLKAAINYIKDPSSKENEIFLYGNENIFKNNKSLIKKYSDRIKFINTTDIVDMNDKPSNAFRNKRNSSIIKMIDDIKEKKVDAAVSSGNTGVLLMSGLLILGKINGIKRPALAPFIPIGKKGFILCDAGANSSCKPEHLLQFAIMSSAYLEHLEITHKPKVALLNIGLEENKGNELCINTYELLKNNLSNFVGNIESRELFKNKADIVLCDGFTGNIVIKLIEGIISHMIKRTMTSVNSHSLSKLVKPVLSPVFDDISKSFDYEEYGGTPLLGVDGLILKCHGASNSKAILNALHKTQKTYENNLIEDLEKEIRKYQSNMKDVII